MRANRGRSLTEGLAVGLIGWAAIAGYYALANGLAGRSPFATAERLGRGLLADPGTLPAFAPVLAYNAVHLVVLLAAGVGVVWLVRTTENHPRAWFPLLLLGVVALSAVTLAFFLIAVPATESLPWLSAIGANAAAAVAMAAFLIARHRRLWDEVEREARAGAV